MNNAQLYDRVLVKCRRPGDAILRGFLADEIREMLSTWERGTLMPWFLAKVATPLTLTIGLETVALPVDYLNMVEDTKLFIVRADGSKKALPRGFHEDIEQDFINSTPSEPKVYDVFGLNLYFGPVPDYAYGVRFKYFGATTPPPDDVAAVSNPWALYVEDLFVAEASRRLNASYIKDAKRNQELIAEVSGLQSNLWKYNESRMHVDMDYSVDR